MTHRDPDYILNPNSRRQMMDVMASPVMSDIASVASGAVAAYQRALAVRPDYPEALSNLGTALADKGLDGLLLIGDRQFGLAGMQTSNTDVFAGRINAGDIGSQTRQGFT